jgi:hypothetical protein
MTDITAHARVVVHRPAAGVWRILADDTRDPEWRDAVVAMVPDPATSVVVGTTTAETLCLGGRTRHDGLVTEVSSRRRPVTRTARRTRCSWRTTRTPPAARRPVSSGSRR